MYVELNLPTVSRPHAVASRYWLRYSLVGSPSQNREVNALASTFARLVEAAIVEYGLGAETLRQFWAPDRAELDLPLMHRSIAHFESCVSDMHRAILAYRRLRNHEIRDPLSGYVSKPRPTFAHDRVANRIRDVRDAIHHLDEKVLNGEIAEGEPIALKPEGPEVPHATEPGQTVKTMDRLMIGPHQIAFSDLAFWLNEMSTVAARIAEFDLGRCDHWRPAVGLQMAIPHRLT